LSDVLLESFLVVALVIASQTRSGYWPILGDCEPLFHAIFLYLFDDSELLDLGALGILGGVGRGNGPRLPLKLIVLKEVRVLNIKCVETAVSPKGSVHRRIFEKCVTCE